MYTEIAKIGKRGALVIPASMRQHFGLHDGDMVIIEDRQDGLLIKPAITLPIENYSLERQAEFLLSNAIDSEDYEQAKNTVREMGLDPDKITHYKPLKKKAK